ncbi:MAG: CocE/NonD family hydrolase, partial [Bacteroidota bacterium]
MKSFLLTATFFFGFLSLVRAQLDPTPISIPMRDGQSLAADLYLPNATGTFPVILIQTPYNKNTFQLSLPLGVGMDLENSPYAFVVVDWRCFYGSIGACIPEVNRGEDGYDAVEWIAEQDWSDGQIGTWGPSALGQVQFETAREQPPHLVCAMPSVASPQTTFKSYYPGGSIRVEFVETFGILFGGGGNDIVLANPFYNALWQFVESSSLYPEEIKVPMFLVAGWYDHNTEDCFFIFDQLRNNSDPSVQDQHKMIIGPWVHGGTGFASVGTETQGELSYPDAQGFNAILGREFFDYYLRGLTTNGWDNYNPYYYFQMGTDEWRETDVWPPAEAESISWYAHPDGQLLPQAPSETEGQFSYAYDPEDPSPTIGGKTLNLALEQGPLDQVAQVESRPDVAIF